MEKILVQFVQQNQFHQVSGGIMETPRYRQMLHCATCEESCYALTVKISVIAELHCTFEEADTRLILHAANAGLQSAIFTAEDIDVMALCFAFQ